jgi:hypothetical protein
VSGRKTHTYTDKKHTNRQKKEEKTSAKRERETERERAMGREREREREESGVCAVTTNSCALVVRFFWATAVTTFLSL